MDHFFASLYNWFGIITPYPADFDNYMRGLDYGCTGFYALHWYVYIGWLMIITTCLIFGLQFDLVSTNRFTQPQHWVLTAFIIFIVNFITGFTMPFVGVFTHRYCLQLHLSGWYCVAFATGNAAWALIIFMLLSAITPLRNLLIKVRQVRFLKR